MNSRKSVFLLFFALFIVNISLAQQRINPVIKNYGGIFDAPHATEKPDPDMEYKVIVDIVTADSKVSEPFYSIVNVARLMNLHAMGGVKKENMKIVMAIHGGAVWSVLNNEKYNEKYGIDNPHIPLFKELQDAGVKIVVCSQSMMGRQIDHTKLAPGLETATSMLTTMTTYQLKGYAALKF
ncbi:DsrE family protein [Roseivirga sp.]|uniref:DsrE family protein n=1 Tax=Roseivirga sp. TaxID=1964215 RepID=UPI003B8C896C